MEMTKPLVSVAAAVVLSWAITQAAHAQDGSGGYLGASLGDSDLDGNGLDGSSSYRFFGGYLFTPNLGVEVGYSDLGGFDARAGGTIDVTGAYVAGVGSFAIADRFDLLGKVGAFHYEAESSVGGGRDSSEGTSLMLGFGLNYRLTGAVDLGAEYNLVDGVEDGDADTIWLNLQFSLGSY